MARSLMSFALHQAPCGAGRDTAGVSSCPKTSSRAGWRALARMVRAAAVPLVVLALAACSTTGGLPSQGFAPAVQRVLPATVGIYAAPVGEDGMDSDPVHPPHIGAGFLVD